MSAVMENPCETFPVDRLPELAEVGFAFCGESHERFVPSVFQQSWTAFLNSGLGEIFTIEQDGRFVGALGAIIYPDPNAGFLVATETFWYVLPEHRGQGLRLLDQFEAWAVRRGASRIGMAHLHELMPTKLERLYRRRGYAPKETHYFKDLP